MGSARWGAACALLALIYWALGKAGLQLAQYQQNTTLVWPPLGIALAVYLLGGMRLWPGVWIGACAVCTTTGLPLAPAAAIATGNSLAPLAAAAALRSLGFDAALARVRDVVRFLCVGAVGSALLTATGGAMALLASGIIDGDSFAIVWTTWWMGDANGAMVTAPLVLVWAAGDRGEWFRRSRRVEITTGLALTTALALPAFAIGGELGELPLAFISLAFPALMAAALRFGPRGAATSVAIVAFVAIAGTATERGPFAVTNVEVALALLLIYLAVLVASTLLLAAAITEGRISALAHLRSEERLRRVIEATSEGIWEWDLRTGRVDFSETWMRTLGLHPSEVVKHVDFWAERVHPEDMPRVQERLDAHFAGDTDVYEVENRLRRADGSWRWSLDRGRVVERDDDGRPVRMIGTDVDITERKASEEELRQSRELLTSVLDSLNQHVAVIDADGEILLVNEAWASFGARRGAPGDAIGVGSNYLAACDRATRPDDDDAREVVAGIRSVISGARDSFSAEYACHEPDGEQRWFVARVTRFRGPGRPRAVISHVDVTERRAAQARQELLLHELDHRVKNTLATVIGLADRAGETSGSVEAFQAGLEGRLAALARTHELLARERWGGVDLGELARLLAHGLGTNDRLAVSGGGLAVPASAVLPLGLALNELATNALKHGAWSSRAGGVELSLARDPSGGLEVRWEESGGPPADEPAEAGTGLGLVRDLVGRQLGGEAAFAFASTGLRCTLRIPRDPPSAVAPAGAGEAPSPNDSTEVPGILILEDDVLQSRMLARLVARSGYRVVGPTETVSRARQLLEEEPVAAALLDVNLGDRGSSAELALHLLERGTPFAFLTGYAEPPGMPSALDGIPRITKPVEPARLQTALREMV